MKSRTNLLWMVVAVGGCAIPCETSITTSTTTTTETTEGPSSCEECYSYVECPQSTNVCRTFTCEEGRCVERDLAPEHLCEDVYPCWRGACCYTCLIDSGVGVGAMDPQDGPCVSGLSDHACGVGGVLCRDCTAQGEVCVAGQCVNP